MPKKKLKKKASKKPVYTAAKPRPMQYHPETRLSPSHVVRNLRHPEEFFEIIMGKNLTLVIDYFLFISLFWTLGSVIWSLTTAGNYEIGLINGLFMFAGAMITGVLMSILVFILARFSASKLSFNDSFKVTVSSLAPVYIFSVLRWYNVLTLSLWLLLCFFAAYLMTVGLIKLNVKKGQARLMAVLFIIGFLALQVLIRQEVVTIVLAFLRIKYTKY